MKKLIAAILIISIPFLSNAQFGNLLKKAKDKVAQRADSKVDKEMDKKLDELEGKKSIAPADNATASTEEVPTEKKQTIKSFSKFDFIPGERILYAEDFSQDNIGELPLSWNSSGKGEVMTIEGRTGKWLRVFQNNAYLSGNRRSFGENYTIEFDALFYFQPVKPGYILPSWYFGLFTSGGVDPADNSFLQQRSEINSTEITIGHGGQLRSVAESKQKRVSTFKSDLINLGDEKLDWNKLSHFSVQVQKSRLRVWMDERKIYDIPRGINTTDTLNQLFFRMESSNYKDEEIGLFISNIKIATGLPDTRHKLLDEGKFSTTGILFDVNAATIKPESAGVLKEIGTVLKENEGVKIKIIGHTDSDGADAANLDLSKKRSEAVKAALAKDFGIDESRMETDGKGESKPVADNKTKEGKAQNRRVEFVKL